MQFQPLQLLALPGVKAFCVPRGVEASLASDPYAGFSVCDYTGDTPAKIAHCRDILAGWLGAGAGEIIMPRQTHSANVAVITPGYAPGSLYNTDALVCSCMGKVIGVNTADCVPVVLADAEAGVVAVAHAGWRGAAAGIVARTLCEMLALGCRPDRVHVAFGPSICADCFEVGPEVVGRFPGRWVKVRPKWPRPHVDLQGFIRQTLIDKGVEAGNIDDFNRSLCTRCHPGEFFSARAMGVKSGRVFTFAYLE